jgi:hypothetical protein
MSAWLVALTGIIYAYISVEQLFKGEMSMFIVYLGYALANVGLFMAVK